MLTLRSFLSPTPGQYAKLLSDPAVRRHLPLSSGPVGAEWCQQWMRGKHAQWPDPDRMGPWSVWHDGRFVGWAGVEPEDRADEGALAVVLEPAAWGLGLEVARLVVDRFRAVAPDVAVVVELPLSRRPHRVMQRWGLVADGLVEISGVPFHRFVLR